MTGRFICLHKPLVDADKVFLPPLHLKLGLMKNFVKARDHDSAGFHCLSMKFKDICSEAKVKAGDFNGPQILLILNYQDIVNTLNVSLG